jgi:hypothetical protein
MFLCALRHGVARPDTSAAFLLPIVQRGQRVLSRSAYERST